MYSPRRKSYRYRSKKYYRNNLFAPSLYKAPAPNFYQMKGRIIQQTPSNMHNPPTELITRKKLEEMYQKLVQYKYPIPQPIPPSPIDPQYFFYSFRTPYIDYENYPEHITVSYIYVNYVSSIEPQLPTPPTGYVYRFQLTSINWSKPYWSNPDESRLAFTWTSTLSENPITLLEKSVNSQTPNSHSAELFAVPAGNNLMRASKIEFQQALINYKFVTFATTDISENNNTLYPLISSYESSETYDGVITITKSGFSDQNIALNIAIFLVSNDF